MKPFEITTQLVEEMVEAYRHTTGSPFKSMTAAARVMAKVVTEAIEKATPAEPWSSSEISASNRNLIDHLVQVYSTTLTGQTREFVIRQALECYEMQRVYPLPEETPTRAMHEPATDEEACAASQVLADHIRGTTLGWRTSLNGWKAVVDAVLARRAVPMVRALDEPVNGEEAPLPIVDVATRRRIYRAMEKVKIEDNHPADFVIDFLECNGTLGKCPRDLEFKVLVSRCHSTIGALEILDELDKARSVIEREAPSE